MQVGALWVSALVLAAAAPVAVGAPSTSDRPAGRLLTTHTVLVPKRPRIATKWFGPSTAISWGTGTARNGSLYVAAAGKRERVIARGTSGSELVRWIVPGVRYRFRLYARVSALPTDRVVAGRASRHRVNTIGR